VNECICHGIPDSRPLVNGDIINIDVTVYLNVRAKPKLPRQTLAMIARSSVPLLAMLPQTQSNRGRKECIPSACFCLCFCSMCVWPCPQTLPFRRAVELRQGYHGDTSRMFYVGRVSDKARRLCEATKECLDAAIAQCGPGVPISRIGQARPRRRLSHPLQRCWHNLVVPLAGCTRKVECGPCYCGSCYYGADAEQVHRLRQVSHDSRDCHRLDARDHYHS